MHVIYFISQLLHVAAQWQAYTIVLRSILYSVLNMKSKMLTILQSASQQAHDAPWPRSQFIYESTDP